MSRLNEPNARTPGLEERAVQVHALLRCAMVAEENQTSGIEWKGLSEVLSLAEEMMEPIIEALEQDRQPERR